MLHAIPKVYFRKGLREMKGYGKVIGLIIVISAVIILAVSGISALAGKSGNSSAGNNNSAANNTADNTNIANNTENTAESNTADNTVTPAPTGPVSEDPIESKNGGLDKTVFVGDSICSGFRVYKFVPDNNCLAYGNVGARSVFDYQFKVDGVEYDLITAIKKVNPSYVVFSMGMNDINLTSEEQYCTNYDDILAKIHEALPDAKLFIASITPTTGNPSFPNDKIDKYNAALKSHFAGTSYTYVDVASSMKDGTNSLKSDYHSGDGLHLSPKAYQVYLNVLAGVYQSMGIAW